jgi:hypothetical protein
VADDDAGEALGVQASRLGAQVNPASEFAQASYFVEIMRTELLQMRKVAKEAQRRWSVRRVRQYRDTRARSSAKEARAGRQPYPEST